jgi:hypothetical protein
MAMWSKLATPPYSTYSDASPMEPIIIPPPSVDIHDLSFAQHQRSFPGALNAVSPLASIPYQTKAEFAAATTTSPDIIALAGLFGTLKHTLTNLSTMFGEIGDQTEKMVSLGPATKAAEQVLSYTSLHD